MNLYLPDLQVIQPNQRSMITDIVLTEPDPSTEGALNLSHVRAYLGGRDPVWLADPTIPTPESMEQVQWLHDFIQQMRTENPDEPYFRFSHGDDTFRCKRRVKDDGTRRLTMRRIPQRAPYLEDLQMPRYVPELLTALPLKRTGGLVLIVAPVGQGKSTTIAATLGSRAKIHGGQTVTIEKPVEHYLDGFHGTGEIIQTSVADEPGAWAAAVRESLGDFAVFPGGGATLFVGEIRDGETCAECLRASQAGYLVFATLHAQSLQNTVFRLISLASDVLGEKDAADTVASALRMVIYQTLTLIPRPIGWKRGSLACDVLFNAGPDSAVASIIRDPKASIDQLADPIAKQRQAFINANRDDKPFEELYAALGGKPDDLA